ncbi:MAG: efflux RND transporter periplasmic adaptor subunit [Planctomycetaceae bacterium]|jgi:RND family efflux transporter MFP subunit|nr:efflux RND transporter periplasmic adaptor subunit [Planctomycetaceae bacterium]
MRVKDFNFLSILFVTTIILLVGIFVGFFVHVNFSGGGLVAAGGNLEGGKSPKGTLRPVRPASPVRVDVVRKDSISNVRLFHGRLVEVQRSRISSEVSGLVSDLPIEIGMRVKGGETLFAQIDKTWLSLVIEQTEAEIRSLSHRLAHEEGELRRLLEPDMILAFSESQRSQQKTLVEQYSQDLEKAKVANREAKEKLKRTTIVAPYDGYIIRRETGKNELLSPGMSIAEVVSLGEVDARVMISEDIIDRIRVGDEVAVVVDSLGVRVVGKVHRIVPYAPTGARIFPVLVRLSDQGGHLKVGMSITAEIVTNNPSEEILVSKDSVLDRPDGAIVWLAIKTNKQTDKQTDKQTNTQTDAQINKETTNNKQEEQWIAKPIPVKIKVTAITDYGVVPETDEGKKLLVAGAKTIIEGAEKLTANQVIRIDTIDPKLLENLPSPNGQKIINPKQRNEN